MMTEKDNRHALLELKKQILDRLRSKMPAEVAQLEALEAAIDSSPPPQGEYADVKMGVDALVMHLRKIGRPMDRAALCRAVVDGGWGNGDPNSYWKLIDMVRYQVEDAKRPRLVKAKGRQVWLRASELQDGEMRG